jgi:hypothetical protein
VYLTRTSLASDLTTIDSDYLVLQLTVRSKGFALFHSLFDNICASRGSTDHLPHVQDYAELEHRAHLRVRVGCRDSRASGRPSGRSTGLLRYEYDLNTYSCVYRDYSMDYSDSRAHEGKEFLRARSAVNLMSTMKRGNSLGTGSVLT